jgi:CheY-like chemotaxis protein
MIEVLVVDDHLLFRQGIINLLEQVDEIKVVGQAESSTEAIQIARTLLPDVIVMDIMMKDKDGIATAKELRQRDVQSAIVLVIMQPRVAFHRARAPDPDPHRRRPQQPCNRTKIVLKHQDHRDPPPTYFAEAGPARSGQFYALRDQDRFGATLSAQTLMKSQDSVVLNENYSLLFVVNTTSDGISAFSVYPDTFELTFVQRVPRAVIGRRA